MMKKLLFYQPMKKEGLKGVEAVLFDFEGTLVDFQWNLKGAVRETLERLKAFGFPIDWIQGKKYSTLMSEAMKLAPEVGRSSQEVREMIGEIYDWYDQDALTRWSLRPGAKEVLGTLRSTGLKTALVSNVGKRALEIAFQKLDLHSLFNLMVCRNDVQALKPSGEGITLALRRLQIAKEKALFVGDSLDDVQASREAGLRVFIILGGESPKADLLSSRPDGLIQNFDELIASTRGEPF